MIPGGNTLEAFEREMARQDDIVYGIALLFECLTVIHEDQPAIIETQRKQFRNMIQNGNELLSRATALLENARSDPSATEQLAQFSFSPCQGHPDPDGLSRRAEILTSTYMDIFPDRPRSKDFTREEIFQLIEKASEKMNLQQAT